MFNASTITCTFNVEIKVQNACLVPGPVCSGLFSQDCSRRFVRFKIILILAERRMDLRVLTNLPR